MRATSTRLVSRTLGVPLNLQMKFRQGIQGYLPAASAATGQATIYANSFFEPFATVNPLTTGWASLSLTDASSTAGVFPGTAFVAAGYLQYRVLRAKLTCTAVAGSGGDTTNVWITPLPLSAVAVTKYQAALGNAGTKSELVTGGMRPARIVSDILPAEVIGLRLNQYDVATFGVTSMGTSPTGTNAVVWQVSYATMDGGATTGQVYFDFQIEYEVDFLVPLEQEI